MTTPNQKFNSYQRTLLNYIKTKQLEDTINYASQLFSDETLDLNKKTNILFLGHNNNFSLLEEYVKLIRLENTMTIVQCINELEKKLKIPMESHKIEILINLYQHKIKEISPTMKLEIISKLLYHCITLINNIKINKKISDIEHNNFIEYNKENFDNDFLTNIYNEILILYDNELKPIPVESSYLCIIL